MLEDCKISTVKPDSCRLESVIVELFSEMKIIYYFRKSRAYFMKRALITGITGQDGSYLAEFLLEKGI